MNAWYNHLLAWLLCRRGHRPRCLGMSRRLYLKIDENGDYVGALPVDTYRCGACGLQWDEERTDRHD